MFKKNFNGDNMPVSFSQSVLFTIFISLTTSYSKCQIFSLAENLTKVPIIATGIVIQSKMDTINHIFKADETFHEFEFKVLEVLKGEIIEPSIIIRYEHEVSKPAIAQFEIGDKFIFALKSNYEIYGKRCGRQGASFSSFKTIKSNLSNKEIPLAL